MSQDRLDLIYWYANRHKSFCTEFVDSISEYLGEHDELTQPQEDALDNIISGFRMENEYAKEKARAR